MKAIVINEKKVNIKEVEAPQLLDNYVIVRVAAFGVNQTDFIQQRISVFEGSIPGVEFSGWVATIGRITRKNIPEYQLGQRVCGFVYTGACAEYVMCDARHLIAAPSEFSLVIAAGLVYSWISAIDALYHVAGFKQRDKVLLHVGKRTLLGTALAQYAQVIGCRRVIVVVKSDSHAEFIRGNLKLLGALPDELVAINETRVDWVATVKKIDPRGVQVIINETEDEYEDDCDVLAPNGSLVYIGPRHSVSSSSKVALKGIRVQTTNLRSKNPEYIAKITENFKEVLLPRFRNRRLKVYMERALGWEAYDTAMKLSESSIQKLVCTVSTLGFS